MLTVDQVLLYEFYNIDKYNCKKQPVRYDLLLTSILHMRKLSLNSITKILWLESGNDKTPAVQLQNCLLITYFKKKNSPGLFSPGVTFLGNKFYLLMLLHIPLVYSQLEIFYDPGDK